MTANPLASEIRAASTKDEYDRDRRVAAGRYSAWCDENDFPDFPLDEQVLLRWLYVHRQDWAWSHAKGQVTALNRYSKECGHPAQALPRVRRYLAALKRDAGVQKEDKVDAMTAEEFIALALTLQTPVKPLALPRVRLRGAAAVAWLTGLPLKASASSKAPSVDSLTRDAFLRDANGALEGIAMGSRNITVAPDRAGRLLTFIEEALDATPDGQRPFNIRNSPKRIREQFERATRGDSENWRDWELERMEWALDAFDPDLESRYRDASALLVGVCLARRFQDLRELRLQDVRFEDDGVVITQPFSKTDTTGRGVRKFLTHAVPGAQCAHGAPCAPLCPVQALRDYCAYQRIVRRRTTGSIVETLYAGKRRPMTRAAWNYVLGKAWKRAGLPEGRRISSRSMRVTGASLAKKAGATIEQIQALTDHRDPRAVSIYLRNYDPEGMHIVLLDDE